jgi:hypothetical protein
MNVVIPGQGSSRLRLGMGRQKGSSPASQDGQEWHQAAAVDLDN